MTALAVTAAPPVLAAARGVHIHAATAILVLVILILVAGGVLFIVRRAQRRHQSTRPPDTHFSPTSRRPDQEPPQWR